MVGNFLRDVSNDQLAGYLERIPAGSYTLEELTDQVRLMMLEDALEASGWKRVGGGGWDATWRPPEQAAETGSPAGQ